MRLLLCENDWDTRVFIVVLIFDAATVFVNKGTPANVVKAAIDAVAAGEVTSKRALNQFCARSVFENRVNKLSETLKIPKNLQAKAEPVVCSSCTRCFTKIFYSDMGLFLGIIQAYGESY